MAFGRSSMGNLGTSSPSEAVSSRVLKASAIVLLLRCFLKTRGLLLFCFCITSVRARDDFCCAARRVEKRERERGCRRKNRVLFFDPKRFAVEDAAEKK